MNLFFRESGQGQPLVILHGLFGSSDNWYTVAKKFAGNYHVFLIDQRNHGQSPHSAEFNYQILAEDLHDFIRQHGLTSPVVIGHSMGGKAAMNFAVRYPDELDRLIVVDIVPKAYPVHHDRIVEGLRALPLATLTSRSEADAVLSPYVPDPGERQFLLKNLDRKPGSGFQWKMNLSALDAHLEEIGAGMVFPGQFTKPSLFIFGTSSPYFKAGDEGVIKEVFPAATIVHVETGHWVQAENPEVFATTVLRFLKP